MEHPLEWFYLNKIDNGLSNKPKRLNKMFNSILAYIIVLGVTAN